MNQAGNKLKLSALSAVTLLLVTACGGGGDSNGGKIDPNALIDDNGKGVVIQAKEILPAAGGSGDTVELVFDIIQLTNNANELVLEDELIEVHFGDRVAVPIPGAASPNSVLVQVPAQTVVNGPIEGPVDVRAEFFGFEPVIFEDGFTYLTNADCGAPGATAVINSVDDIFLGSTTTFKVYGTDFDGDSLVRIEGLAATVVSFQEDVYLEANVPAGIANLCSEFPCDVGVVIANDNGCSSAEETTTLYDDQVPIANTQVYGEGLPSGLVELYYGASVAKLGNVGGEKAYAVVSSIRVQVRAVETNDLIWEKLLETPFPAGGYTPEVNCFGVQAASVISNVNVKNGGDIDGDGTNDVIIEDRYSSSACILSGDDGATLFESESVSPPPLEWYVGFTVSGIGDLDGDGSDEFAIGKNFETISPAGGFQPGDIEIYTKTNCASGYCVLNYWPGNSDAVGYGENIVSAGPGKVAVSARCDDEVQTDTCEGGLPLHPGAVYIYNAADILGAGVNQEPNFTKIKGQAGVYERFGQNMIAFGSNQIVVSAINASNNEMTLRFFQNGSSQVLVVKDFAPGDLTGSFAQIADGSDIDGDGVRDLLIGDSTFTVDPQGPTYQEGKVIALSGADLDNTIFEVIGEPSVYGLFGYANFGLGIAGLGDSNGDGFAEIVVGAPRFDPYASSGTGKVYVFNKQAVDAGLVP